MKSIPVAVLKTCYLAHYTRLEGLGYTFTDDQAVPLTKEEAAQRCANKLPVVNVEPVA